ncbi:single-stranded DNA-binding protein [uncultured Paracoccus sp.]|uniref:single-stranded DNA-binding protein n=1 Tax=uncultured Paracoccus sp. TaxID=189685 RepID=UPI00262CC760|nr:single-stranded DNA-binding protein [uncultured Paracoccus sp.]
MKTFAKHFTQGYVGKIKEVGTTLKISIASSYRQRNQNGDYEDRTYWNTLTVFDEARMKFIKTYVREGDLVQAEGMIREDSYDKNGEIVYTTLLIARDFQLLSTKAERDARRASQPQD